MTIERATYDNCYPFRIYDAWDGQVCADEEDLKDLMEQIKMILKENDKND